MVCDWWECSRFDECMSQCLYSGANYPPCACCVHFDRCDLCSHYVECADLVTRYLPQLFRRMVRDIRLGENLQRTEQIINRNTLGGRKRK